MRKILSRILFCREYDLDCVLIHIPVGMANVGVGVFNLLLGAVFGWGFVRYELAQWKECEDRASPAIQGWLWGVGILSIILLMVKLWS